MARFKLNEADEEFLKLPQGAALISAGSSGTQTWIERDRDVVVHIAIKSVAMVTADGGTLQVCIEIGGDSAKGEDGPLPIESQLHASQSVQVLVKAGERLAFKAYPIATKAQVLKTVVWAADFKSDHDVDSAARTARASSTSAGAPATH
jgi:hypothetical protein